MKHQAGDVVSQGIVADGGNQAAAALDKEEREVLAALELQREATEDPSERACLESEIEATRGRFNAARRRLRYALF